MKNCVLCKHFYLVMGCDGYSEATPGWNADMGCGMSQSHWEWEPNTDDEADFRAKMLTAENCADYVHHSRKGE